MFREAAGTFRKVAGMMTKKFSVFGLQFSAMGGLSLKAERWRPETKN
jgi:hypothetical protein